MATTIEQKPLYTSLPVGQDIIYVVKNDSIVNNQARVKFIAEIHISNTTQINLATNTNKIGTFKTTPNSAGVGIFNLRNIVENYVKSDNMASDGSSYKGTTTSSTDRHSLHLIDKFSKSENTIRHLAIKFGIEYLDNDQTSATFNQIIQGSNVNSDDYQIWNAYLKYEDKLQISNNDFGFNRQVFLAASTGSISANTKRYLTNAPTTQYANSGDYGTLAVLLDNSTTWGNFSKIRIKYYNHSNIAYAGEDVIDKNSANGANSSWSTEIKRHILFFGCFPGNLENWSSNYATAVTGGLSYYTIQAEDAGTSFPAVLNGITIYVNCPDRLGYDPIRLCWLNQWGAWDYYTFIKKSVKNISTQGSTYTQLEGTWNESAYKLDSFKGGKRSFRINAAEKITINTDFVKEIDNVMFEELINSPEIYLLESFQTDASFSAYNQYVTPVRLTTSTFTKKTRANDRLIQYTFEIEKSKNLRTQSI
jgi:hypothetical protein